MATSREERAAAREWLEHDHARHTLSGEPAHVAHENAKELEEQYPRARDIALTGTEQELGELPAELRRHQMRRRRASGLDTRRVQRVRTSYRSSSPRRQPAPRTPAPAQPPSPARRAASTASSAAGSAADWLGDTSWGGLVGDFLMWGMGLSIFYLLLTHNKSVSELALGATNTARAVISPHIDPLSPGRSL